MKETMNLHEKIQHMEEFTKVYAACPDDIYQREALCLQIQLSYTMLPPKPEDLIAGRKTELPLGFSPQNTYGTVGYYCEKPELLSMLEDPDLTKEDEKILRNLLQFWDGKTTVDKLKAHYTEDMQTYLSPGDYKEEGGTAFPLYRMSGAQMAPDKLLKKGLDQLIAETEKRASLNPPFYNAVSSALKSFQNLCFSYSGVLEELADQEADNSHKKNFLQMSENLKHIAHKPPISFWQAAQLSYLYYLVSGTYNYGRMDEYLGEFYAYDLDHGLLTEPEALEIIKSLWSLIIERKTVFDGRVILGGKDRTNIEASDRFAMAAMEASRQLKDVLPQLTLRCYKGMDPLIYDKALQLIGEGTTYPILYNDDLNIPCVSEAFEVSEQEAASYVPFGCGEYVLYNKSFGTPSGIINYLYELNAMIYEGEENLLSKCETYSEFYHLFLNRLSKIIRQLSLQEKLEYDICAQDAPYLYFSILFEDCLNRGRPVFDGGICYLGGTLEGYGNINTSDSLTAIKKLIYEEKKVSPRELAQALKNNFKGYEGIRKLLLEAPKYGNDDPYADSVAVQFHEDVCQIIRECKTCSGLDSYLEVIINNDTNTIMGTHTGASADGRFGYTFMANANNPTGGMDKNGVTAFLNSLVKLSPKRHAGAVQNMRFSKEMFGPLLPKTKGLLSAYFHNGGAQAMITVLNRGDLEQAMIQPEKYQNLIVRVGGFSARFVELSKDDQAELLSRTLY